MSKMRNSILTVRIYMLELLRIRQQTFGNPKEIRGNVLRFLSEKLKVSNISGNVRNYGEMSVKHIRSNEER